MTGILGSGFGLYGYLPCMLNFENQVCLLAKSKEQFLSRNELLHFEPAIQWIDTLSDLLTKVDTLIICIPPFAQSKILAEICQYPNIRNLILEKPIAPSPGESSHLLKVLHEKYNIRISYIFLYAYWFKKLKQFVSGKQELQINLSWHFKAHHFIAKGETWKRDHLQGGGIIRFYCIHLFAVLADIAFETLLFSEITIRKGNYVSWNAVFLDPSRNEFSIHADSDSEHEQFMVHASQKGNLQSLFDDVNIPSPFKENMNNLGLGGIDGRVKYLDQLYEDLINRKDVEATYNLYSRINNLWHIVEEKSTFKNID